MFQQLMVYYQRKENHYDKYSHFRSCLFWHYDRTNYSRCTNCNFHVCYFRRWVLHHWWNQHAGHSVIQWYLFPVGFLHLCSRSVVYDCRCTGRRNRYCLGCIQRGPCLGRQIPRRSSLYYRRFQRIIRCLLRNLRCI